MPKTITVPCRVPDLAGLYYDLRRSGFVIHNVGGTQGETYVYLDPAEEKDPTPVVEEWSKREAPSMKEVLKRRAKVMEEMEAERILEEKRKAEEEARLALERENQEVLSALNGEETFEMPAVSDEAVPEEVVKSPSFIKRLWNKFF